MPRGVHRQKRQRSLQELRRGVGELRALARAERLRVARDAPYVVIAHYRPIAHALLIGQPHDVLGRLMARDRRVAPQLCEVAVALLGRPTPEVKRPQVPMRSVGALGNRHSATVLSSARRRPGRERSRCAAWRRRPDGRDNPGPRSLADWPYGDGLASRTILAMALRPLSVEELAGTPTLFASFMGYMGRGYKTFSQLLAVYRERSQTLRAADDSANDLRVERFMDEMASNRWDADVVLRIGVFDGAVLVIDGIHRGLAYLACVEQGLATDRLPALHVNC